MGGLRIDTFDPLADDAALAAWVEVGLASARDAYGDRHAAYTAQEAREGSRMAFSGHGPRDGRRPSSSAACHPDAGTRRGFAQRHGYRSVLVNLRSDLELPAGSLGDLLAASDAVSAVRSAGYDVLTWWDDVPAAWLDARAMMSSRMSTDAPMGGLDVEAEVWDADRAGTCGDGGGKDAGPAGRREPGCPSRHRRAGRFHLDVDPVVRPAYRLPVGRLSCAGIAGIGSVSGSGAPTCTRCTSTCPASGGW